MIPGVTPNGLGEELEMTNYPVVFGHWSYPFSINVFPVVVLVLVAIVSYQAPLSPTRYSSLSSAMSFSSYLLDIRGKTNAVQAQDE